MALLLFVVPFGADAAADGWDGLGTDVRTLGPSGDWQIEIVSQTDIPGGVEVLAKAWDAAGTPVGFGDGSVEIERFRILNPPTRVPTGTTRTVTTPEGDLEVPNYRSDPARARLMALEDAITRKRQRFLASPRLVPGKIGHTTTIVYATAGADGSVLTSSGVWATARNATTGTLDSASANANFQAGDLSGGTYYLMRNFYGFDTRWIEPTDSVDTASLSLYVGGLGADADTQAYVLTEFTPAAEGNLNADDFNDCASTELSSRVTYASLTANAYNTWSLNAAGLLAVDFGSWTNLCLRSDNDYDNVAPTGRNYRNFYYADSAGTVNDPKLTIESTPGASSDATSSGTNTEIYQAELANFVGGWTALVWTFALFALLGWGFWKNL